MAEILLYSPIFNFTAEFFIRELEEFKDEDVVARLHTPGGDVLAAWGMIAKALEHPNKFSIKVDGQAASMGAYLLLFFDDVSALNFSRFTLHRASMFNESGRSEADITLALFTIVANGKDWIVSMMECSNISSRFPTWSAILHRFSPNIK